MTDAAERWERIADAFHDALEQPPERRARFLDTLARTDATLVAEVRSLLDAADRDSRRLDGVKVAAPRAAGDETLEAGARIGAWRIAGLVGSGGMGEVYRAERADGAYRQVAALKVLKAAAVEHLGRFHAERQILAGLQHPGIARLLDGGVTEQGRPWMALEFIEGLPIHEWCRVKGLGLDARLDLFRQVCDAVSHAHANLIVHRDLKPANILVTNDGQAKLLDFGIAKLIAADAAAAGEMTRAAPLTPEYAAPEQLDGRPVTTATDVYGLGITLFELLAGERPFDVRNLPLSAALKTLLHETPPPPSTVASKRDSPPLPPRLIAGDLDAIVAKALRKRPSDRYATANALKDDLERYARRETVSAQPDSASYRLARFVGRHRVGVGVALAIAVLLVAFTVRLAQERTRAVQAEARARAEAQAAREVSDYVLSLFEAADPDRTGGKPIDPRVLVDQGHRQLAERLDTSPATKARMLGTLALLYCRMGVVQECRADAESALKIVGPAGDMDARASGLEAIARVNFQEMRFPESEAAARELVALLESQAGTPDRALAYGLDVLAQSLMEQSKNAEAMAVYERSLALQRNADGSLGRDSCETRIRLARLYADAGRRDEAARLAEETLALAGSEPLDEGLYRRVLLDYADTQYALGNTERQVWANAKGLEITLRVYGPESTETMRVENNFATALNEMGRAREAIPHIENVVRLSRATGLAESPDFSVSLSNLASILESVGEYERAEAPA
ncbi:MAG TPA: serine/threonine-protein kinase, partial [Nevskiaceae bacterium]|nr:serine/threonine-protein kinase [Nevskiaceae bacterium]